MPDPFDRVLRNAARRGRGVGVCPDAAMLAAYVDEGLTPAERRDVEAHAAGCVACQEHLSLLGSVSVESPAPEAARSWFPRWAWLVPAATAVILAAVWVRLPEQHVTDQLTRANEVASSTSPTPSSPPTPSSTSAAPGVIVAAPAELKRKRDEAAPQKVEAAPSAAPAPLAAAAPTAPLPPSVAQDIALAEERFADAEGGERAARQESQLAKSRGDSALTDAIVVSASRDEAFRATGNRIERSTDDGKTWQPAMATPNGTFSAAACDRGVCWFGTTDGRIERRIRGGFAGSVLPVRERVVAIVPSGAATARVTLASGQSFRTTDSGATWSAEP